MTIDQRIRGRRRRAAWAGLCAVAALSSPMVLPGSAMASAATPAVAASSVALITMGGTTTISWHGRTLKLGKLGDVRETAAATPSGAVVVGNNSLKLITPSGSVKTLSGKAIVTGFAVSPDGRFLAWADTPDGPGAHQVNQLLMYDLTQRKLTHTRVTHGQVQPVGFLSDGRVAVQGQGLSPQSYLWTPTTGLLHKLGDARNSSVDRAAGHLLVLSDENDGCSGEIKDSRSGAAVHIVRQCEFLERLSPDGTRWLTVMPSANDSGFIALPGIADGRTGKPDLRLSQLFYRASASITDAVWLDADHVLVIDNRPRAGSTVGEQLEQSCLVPVDAAPSCTTIKDLGRYRRAQQGSDAGDIGPVVLLVHPLGQ